MKSLKSTLAARHLAALPSGQAGRATRSPGVSGLRDGFWRLAFFWCLTGLLVTGASPAAWAQWEEARAPVYGFAPAKSRPAPFEHARYRGIWGDQLVTVQLGVTDDENGNPTLIRGAVRFDSSPTVLHELRSWRAYRSTAPLKLVEADSAQLQTAVGFWETDQPAGPYLTGTWTSPAGERRRFELREDHRDQWGKLATVAYEVLTAGYVVVKDTVLSITDWRIQAEKGRSSDKWDVAGDYSQDYLHLLGPDTLRPALANLQCPPPMARGGWARRAATEKLRQLALAKANGYFDGYHGTEEKIQNLWVEYLDYGLLSIFEDNSYCSGQTACSHSFSNTAYDLNEGGILRLDDVIQPGALAVLSRLLGRHLRADDQYGAGDHHSYEEEPELMPLPVDNQFGLVDTGMKFQYSDWELPGFRWGPELVVPWAELLPLLRPDTPIARMLRERGLWSAPKAGL